jgi:hypothetical protein
VVERVASAVTLFAPGDEVYYAGSISRPGTDAQFHLVDEAAALVDKDVPRSTITPGSTGSTRPTCVARTLGWRAEPPSARRFWPGSEAKMSVGAGRVMT